MVVNDGNLNVTLDRIAKSQRQVSQLRNVETNPKNDHGLVSGSLAEIAVRHQVDAVFVATTASLRPVLARCHDRGRSDPIRNLDYASRQDEEAVLTCPISPRVPRISLRRVFVVGSSHKDRPIE